MVLYPFTRDTVPCNVFLMTTTEKAKAIRADIKTAQKAGQLGELPAEAKFSVRTSYFAGGSSVDVELRNVPRGWEEIHHDDPGDRFRYGWKSPQAKALAAVLEEILHRHLTDQWGSIIVNGHSIGGHSRSTWRPGQD